MLMHRDQRRAILTLTDLQNQHQPATSIGLGVVVRRVMVDVAMQQPLRLHDRRSHNVRGENLFAIRRSQD